MHATPAYNQYFSMHEEYRVQIDFKIFFCASGTTIVFTIFTRFSSSRWREPTTSTRKRRRKKNRLLLSHLLLHSTDVKTHTSIYRYIRKLHIQSAYLETCSQPLKKYMHATTMQKTVRVHGSLWIVALSRFPQGLASGARADAFSTRPQEVLFGAQGNCSFRCKNAVR